MTNPHLESLAYPPQSDEQADHLVLLLHGWGANFYDLQPLADLLALPHCQFLFPNAPFEHYQMSTGRAWYALEREDFAGLEESRDRLTQWLKSLPEMTGIPPERTAMIGFSQGGAMTLDVGLQFDFAALCSCSGYLHYDPGDRQGEFPPTLLIHGNQDQIVPLAAAQQAQDKLRAIGVKLDYFEFPGGHEIPKSAMVAMRQFLMETLLVGLQ